MDEWIIYLDAIWFDLVWDLSAICRPWDHFLDPHKTESADDDE